MPAIVTRVLLALAGAVAVLLAPASAQNGQAGKPPISDLDVFGRLMVDYANASGADTDFAVDDLELRRAHIGASGSLLDAAKFKFEFSIDESGNVDLQDGYFSYKPDGAFPAITIGHLKTPNSLDESTSSRFITGHERPAFTDAFGLDRRVGVAIADEGAQYTYALGVYGQDINQGAVFGGYALAGRFTYNPVPPTDKLTVHTGASFRFREIDDSQPNLRFRQRPVTHIPGRILGTDRFADSDLFVGVEAAVVKRSFWLAGEYAATFANCDLCPEGATFTGGYIEAGYMFGGRRTMKKGKFDRPKLDGHRLGALSVFFRLDTIDLDDGPVNGGAYTAYIVGEDWWLTDHIHVGVNGFLIDARLGDVMAGLDPAYALAIAGNISEDTVKGVTVRAQFDF